MSASLTLPHHSSLYATVSPLLPCLCQPGRRSSSGCRECHEATASLRGRLLSSPVAMSRSVTVPAAISAVADDDGVARSAPARLLHLPFGASRHVVKVHGHAPRSASRGPGEDFLSRRVHRGSPDRPPALAAGGAATPETGNSEKDALDSRAEPHAGRLRPPDGRDQVVVAAAPADPDWAPRSDDWNSNVVRV